MKKLNVTISDESHQVLTDFKEDNNIKNLDEALDELLKKEKVKSKK